MGQKVKGFRRDAIMGQTRYVVGRKQKKNAVQKRRTRGSYQTQEARRGENGRGPVKGQYPTGAQGASEKRYGRSHRKEEQRKTRVREWRQAQGSEVNRRERKGDGYSGYVREGEYRGKQPRTQRERRERRRQSERQRKVHRERVDRGEVRLQRKRKKERRRRMRAGGIGRRMGEKRRVATIRSGYRPREARVGRRRTRQREKVGKEHRKRRREYRGRRSRRRGTDRKGRQNRGYGVRVRGLRNGSRRTKEWHTGRRGSSSKNLQVKEWEGVAKTSVGTRGVKVRFKWADRYDSNQKRVKKYKRVRHERQKR